MHVVAHGQETAKELDLGIKIAHQSFMERHDSIIESKCFGGELLRVKLTEQVTSFLAS